MKLQPFIGSAASAVSAKFRRLPVATTSFDVLTFDDGHREKRNGWVAAGLFFGAFFVWGSFIRLDAAATAGGVIAVSGSRQTVQHKEGGNIAALYVREGQRVRQGQLLLRLAGDETLALARSLRSQVIALQAQRARLFAERSGAPMEPPPEFNALPEDAVAEAKRVYQQQKEELATRLAEVGDQSGVLGEQAGQARARISGLQGQITANKAQTVLIENQLEGLRELYKKGFASLTRVRELERAAAAIEGDTARLEASVAETGGQIGEVRRQTVVLRSTRQQQVSEELRTVSFNLDDLLPKLAAAQDALSKTEVRAPVAGQVVGLQVFSSGAVITPGQKLLDIVPEKATLVIDAKVSPTDADDLSVGQQAEVKVVAFHDRSLPVLEGRVSRVSADSFEDQRTGVSYYTAEVTVPEDQFRTLETAANGRERIKPGLPVEIMIPLRKRSLLQYLLEPLDQAMWSTMREH